MRRTRLPIARIPETRAAQDYADLVSARDARSEVAQRSEPEVRRSTRRGYGSSLIAGFFVLLPLAALVGGVALLAKRPNPTFHAAMPSSQAAEDLEACSPFASLDGRRLLSFNAARNAVAEGDVTDTAEGQSDLSLDLDAAVDGTPRGMSRTSPRSVAVGVFTVDEKTRRVVLQLPAGPTTYTLLTPMPLDQDGCVLVHGTTNAADLDHSWFGTPASEPPHDGPPGGQ